MDKIENSDFWDGKPDFVTRAIFLEGGGFMPADVCTSYDYTCVFKAGAEWYIHEQGMWLCGGGHYSGGAATRKLEQVTDENVRLFVEDYYIKHPNAIRPKEPDRTYKEADFQKGTSP